MRTHPLLDELETALACGSHARRVRILARITDLFVASAPRYSQDQIDVFDEVMTRLVRAIDAKARARLAHRLAPIANAPSGVVCVLAFDDDIEVARTVLVHSERLGDRELAASAESASQPHLAAIAQRSSLSEAVTDVLLERGDRAVVHALVRNKDARFSEAGFHRLVERAAGDDALATELGRRHDIPRPHLLMLTVKASREVRARLAADNPGSAAAVAGGGRNEARKGAAPAPAQRPDRLNRIGEAEVYQSARDRKFGETATALSRLCDTPIDVVERALRDPGAETVLILAKAAGLSSATAKAVLQLRAGDRGMADNDLERALVGFDRLQPEAARRVLSFFRTRVKKPAPQAAAPAVAVNG